MRELPEAVYLVFFQNLVQVAFTSFDAAVEYCKKRHPAAEMRHVAISSVPLDPRLPDPFE